MVEEARTAARDNIYDSTLAHALAVVLALRHYLERLGSDLDMEEMIDRMILMKLGLALASKETGKLSA